MRYLLSFFLIGLVITSFAQKNAALPDNVRENIEKRIAYERNPSIVVGIIDKNGPRYYSFGQTKANGTGPNEHTIYEIGSISKVFTGIILAQQALDGKLKLDDPVQKYLPQSVNVPKRGDQAITLAHLSDHTSGLPRLPSNLAPANLGNPYADYTVEQLYSFISGHTLRRDIGSEYEYSNLAQGLLGHILALNANTTYEQLMIRTIATPLGMKETKIIFDEAMKRNLAPGHSNGVEVENWDFPTLAGAGAIRSSVYDMLKFLAANIGLTKTPLRKAMDMTHKVRHDKAGRMRVGLGWHIANGKNGDVIFHDGGTGGYRAFAGFVKETGTGVVVLTNSSAGANDIGFHLLNPDAPLNEPKANIIPILRKEIEENGPEAVAAKYDELKKSGVDYDFRENVLNRFGYSYMNNNLPAAVAIFKLNAELFPESSDAYDSYGEALLKYATENYKKSVALNPGNTKGIEALKKLGVDIQPEIIDIPEEIMESYVGSYELTPGFLIEITRSGKQLFAQATGQNKFEIYAKKANEFYYKVVEATITFNVNERNVESLTLHQNGQNVTGKKVK